MIKPHSRAQDSPFLLEAYEREHALLERARAGEDVRNEAVLHMQCPLYSLARRMHWRFSQQHGNVIEVSDLVHSACVEILSSFPVALTKENPFGYLFKVAKVTMTHHLNGRTGHTINTRALGGPVPVLSLDMPGSDGQCLADLLAWELRLPVMSEQQQLCSLQQAVEALPEKQRKVIQHFFGFGEYQPASLNEISRQLFSRTNSPRTGSARRHYKRGLDALRQILVTQFPQYTSHQNHQRRSRSTGGAQ